MAHNASLGRIESLAPGDHLCCLYSTEAEHRAQITPFLQAGLQDNERVLYIADAPAVETVLGYLRTDGFDPAPYLASEQLRIVGVSATYRRGGVFDPDGMVDLLRQETGSALAAGYTGLRVTGEMSWALRHLPDPDQLLAYENRLNSFCPGSRYLVLCQYDRRRFPPALLRRIIESHPFVIAGITVYNNFYYRDIAE